jgi:hypothetical protein
MSTDRDELPDGVINAEPAGGWESGDVADDETRAASSEPEKPWTVPDGFVESAEIQAGLDPDLRRRAG